MICTLCGDDHPGMCDAPFPILVRARDALRVVELNREFTWEEWKQKQYDRLFPSRIPDNYTLY